MKYSYTGRDLYGNRLHGEISADNLDDARRILNERGIHVLQVNEFKKSGIPFLKSGGKVKGTQLSNFAKEMSVMVRAGIPQDAALRSSERQVEGTAFGNILHEVRNDVSAGSSLSVALSKHPHVFDTIFVNMIRAGEESGAIDEAFDNLSDFIKRQEQIRQKVISALIYPALILGFTFLGSLFLIIFVFPRLEDMYASLGGDLPAITRFFLNLKDFLLAYWYLLISGFGAVTFTFFRWLKTNRGKRWKDRTLLKVPLVGPFLQKMAVIRFAKTLASLVMTGTNITRSLEIAGKSSGNTLIEDAVVDMIDGLRQGETITQRLRKYEHVFLPMFISLFSTGEQVGKIDEMLNHVTVYYEGEIEETASRLSSILDPILMGIMIVVIGVILIALYMPVFQMSSLLSG